MVKQASDVCYFYIKHLFPVSHVVQELLSSIQALTTSYRVQDDFTSENLAFKSNWYFLIPFKLMELEQRGNSGTEEYAERLRRMSSRLRETERSLISAKKDVSSYQDMLEQSQVLPLLKICSKVFDKVV